MTRTEGPPLWLLAVLVAVLVGAILVIAAHGREFPPIPHHIDADKVIPRYNKWCEYEPGSEKQERCLQRQNLKA